MTFLTADHRPVPTQVVEVLEGERFSTTVTGAKIRWVVEAMRGPEFRGVRVVDHAVTEEADGTVAVTMREAGPEEAPSSLDPLRGELLARADRDVTFRVRLLRAPARRVVLAADRIPGFGWRTLRAEDVASGDVTGEMDAGVRHSGAQLANGHLSATVDHETGLVALESDEGVVVAGANRLVDGGDGGDTYNYSPPADDRVVDVPTSVAISTIEAGPVRGRIRVEAEYEWPTHAVGDERSSDRRSDEVAPALVTTTYELRAGERFLRVRVELDHHHRDHRLRAHFPLPALVTGSDAECAFAVVHRGLDVEGGPHEFPLPTFPSRRFVDASAGDVGLAVLHDGLLEYELVDDGRELALTLLRATGYLSRAEPALRPNPAGPLDPLAGPQLPGPLVFEYALLPHRGDWRDAGCYAAADEFLVPLERVRGGGVGSELPATGAVREGPGGEVSALQRDGPRLVLRCFNPSPEASTVRVQRAGEPVAGDEIDLRGAIVAPFAGSRTIGPAEIVTLRLTD